MHMVNLPNDSETITGCYFYKRLMSELNRWAVVHMERSERPAQPLADKKIAGKASLLADQLSVFTYKAMNICYLIQ